MTIPFASSVEQITSIPTGLPQLDRILGVGGIPFKRITEISGTWSVGKTTLALSLVKSAQEHGYKCMWIDAEWAWDDQYARTLGVDTTKLMFLQTRVAEDSLNDLLEYVEKGKDTLIIIDAVGALHPRDEAQKNNDERTIGAQSGLIARFCRKIVPLLSMNNNALVVLNHEYEDVMKSIPGRPNPIKTSGGRKLEYHKSIWIRLSKNGDQLKQGNNEDGSSKFVGFRVEAEIKKNKCADTQRQKCTMDMLYGKGFTGVYDLIRDALEKGVLTRAGNTFFFSQEKIGTKKRLDEWLAEHEDELKLALSEAA